VVFAPLGYYAEFVFYRRFGTTCEPHHQGSSYPLTHWLNLDDGTVRSPRNVGKQLPTNDA
jgi:hypothetical protein